MSSGHPEPAASILVSNTDGTSGIRAFDPITGASQGTFSTHGGFGLAVAANGNILHNEGNTIEAYSPSGQDLGAFATTAGFSFGVAAAADGSVYVLQNASSGEIIQKFNSAGASLGTVVAGSSLEGIAVAPNGNLIVDNLFSIDTYTSSGAFLGSTSAGGESFGVTTAPDGTVYFSTPDDAIYHQGSHAGKVYKCTGCDAGPGAVSLFATDPNAGDLNGMLFDGATMFVASRFADDILEFDSTTGAYEGILASTGSSYIGPYSLVLDSTTFAAATPEPGTTVLLVAGLGLIGGGRILRRRHAGPK